MEIDLTLVDDDGARLTVSLSGDVDQVRAALTLAINQLTPALGPSVFDNDPDDE